MSKIQKYVQKLVNCDVSSPKFNIYLSKLNYYYNLRGGGGDSELMTNLKTFIDIYEKGKPTISPNKTYKENLTMKPEQTIDKGNIIMQQFLKLDDIQKMISKPIKLYDDYATIFNKYGHISHLLYFELIGHKIWTFGAADTQQSFTNERNEQIQSISTYISKLTHKNIDSISNFLIKYNNTIFNGQHPTTKSYLIKKLSEETIQQNFKKNNIKQILEKII
jgi:hypothetical protein